jgi:hypothetical protein
MWNVNPCPPCHTNSLRHSEGPGVAPEFPQTNCLKAKFENAERVKSIPVYSLVS